MMEKASNLFLMRSLFEWLEEQKSRENIGPLWRVHDKLYDLRQFIDDHPGGSDWLRMSQGLDITELFESAHFLNPALVDSLLAKFFVREAADGPSRQSRATFEPNGFYRTLKGRAAPVLKKIGTGPTFQCQLMQDALVMIFGLVFLLGLSKDSFLLQILAGIVLALTATGAHNFIHLKANWRRFYFDLSLQSSHECLVFHVMSHHMFATTAKDMQVMDIEQIFKYLNLPATHDDESGSLMDHVEKLVVLHGIYAFKNFLEFALRIHRIFCGEQQFRIENGVVFLQLLLCVVMSTSPMAGIWAWLTIHVVSSYIFMLLAVAPGHHQSAAAQNKNNDVINNSSNDFGLCQLKTISNFSAQSSKSVDSSLALITFGHHGLHHLFPTVCHSKLHHLGPLCEETFEEFIGRL